MKRIQIIHWLHEQRFVIIGSAVSLLTLSTVYLVIKASPSATQTSFQTNDLVNSASPLSGDPIYASVEKLATLEKQLQSEVEERKRLQEEVSALVQEVSLRQDQLQIIRDTVTRVEKLVTVLDWRSTGSSGNNISTQTSKSSDDSDSTAQRDLSGESNSDNSKGGSSITAAKVSLNSATSQDLQTLPGIGPALAGRIITYRVEHGGFKNLEELLQVSGIGEAIFAKLKELIILN